MREKYITTRELCEKYNVSRMTIERLREKGMPFLRKGRNIYFIEEDIDNWMKQYEKIEKYNYENKES